MNLQSALLCDAATDDHGKLNVLGAFDTLCSARMPVVHPLCAVALRFNYSPADEGPHQLKLAIVDADGRHLLAPLEVPVMLGLPEESHFGSRNFIFNLQQLRFDTPGVYAVDVTLDGVLVASIPLQVRLIESPPLDE